MERLCRKKPLARRQVATQQASDDSSSGSEEEEVVVERHVPGRRIARKKTEHEGPSASAIAHGNSLEDDRGDIRVVETLGECNEDEAPSTKPREGGHTTNDSARINELEREVRRSHDHIRKLQQCVRKLLLDAKNKAHADENAQQQQSPQASARMQQQISQLQQEKNQLERNVQQAKEEGQYESSQITTRSSTLAASAPPSAKIQTVWWLSNNSSSKRSRECTTNGANWGVPHHYGSYDLC